MAPTPRNLFNLALSVLLCGMPTFAQATKMEEPGGAFCNAAQPPGGRKAVCMDAFYDVLKPYGTWIETDRYGTLFCPDPTKFDPDFRPFAKGHWVMSEAGWAFVGDHPTSWVTDHYGRWVEASLHGCMWGWVPGEIWSPAWVEFHVGEKVIAWRPAPFDGVPVQLRIALADRLQELRLGPHVAPLSRDAFVAVPDGDFLSPQIQEVALSGPALVSALRETVVLPDATAGLHSRERFEVVAQMMEARGLREPPADKGADKARVVLSGEPPEPAARKTKGAGTAAAAPAKPTGLVSVKKKGTKEGTGATVAPVPTPAGTGKVYWGGDQNQGGFTRPGPQGGVKVLEWDAPAKPKLPPGGKK